MILIEVNVPKPNAVLYIHTYCSLPVTRITDAGYKRVLSEDKFKNIDYVVIPEESLHNNWYKEELFHKFHKHKKTLFYISEVNLYKSTMTTEFTPDIYNTVNGLLDKYDLSNVRIGLETLSNINFPKKEMFYLARLFNNNQDIIRYYTSKCSTNVKFFLSNFWDKRWNRLYEPSDYYCSSNLLKTVDQHKIVNREFNEDLENELLHLFHKYQIKVDKIDFKVVDKYIDYNSEPKLDINYVYDEVSYKGG